MIKRFRRALIAHVVIVLFAGLRCGGVGQPEEGRAVTKRFYDLISASRSRGTTPASEAYKLTTGQASN